MDLLAISRYRHHGENQTMYAPFHKVFLSVTAAGDDCSNAFNTCAKAIRCPGKGIGNRVVAARRHTVRKFANAQAREIRIIILRLPVYKNFSKLARRQ